MGKSKLVLTAGAMLLFWSLAQGSDFTWSSINVMSAAREKLTVAYVKPMMYAFGGFTGVAPVNTTERYEPATNDWQPRASMPTARVGAGAAVVDGKIYVIGGSQGSSYFATNEMYDPALDLWTAKRSMGTPREGCTAVAVNGKIYVIGGNTTTQIFNTTEVYDPATDSWSTKAPMPTIRTYVAAGAIKNKIYVLGGMKGTSYYSTLEVYDTITDSWTTKASMSRAKVGCAVGVAGEKLYVFGGYDGTSYLNTVEEYDSLADMWATKNSLSSVRGYGAVGVIDNMFYVVGGRSRVDPLTSGIDLVTSAEKGIVNVPVLSWLGDGNYQSKGLFPAEGTPSTNYVFKVNYSQYNSYNPQGGFPKVHLLRNGTEIAGSPFSMIYLSGSNTSSIIYDYSTYLSSGSYSYYFETYDTVGSKGVGEPIFSMTGPNVIYDPNGGAGLANAYCFPCPALISKGDKLRFSGITPNAILTILGPDGHTVKKLYADATGVISPWDGTGDAGGLLGSGVYVVHARDNNNNRKIFSIMLVR